MVSVNYAGVEHLSCTETAKVVRGVLAAAFPGVKFSVRSKYYSGGSSISMWWTDGPTVKQVEHVTDRYRGSDFDGMIDLKTHRGPVALEDGRSVTYGADYINGHRKLTPAFLAPIAARVAAKWGWPVPAVKDGDWGARVESTQRYVCTPPWNLDDMVMHEAWATPEGATEPLTDWPWI